MKNLMRSKLSIFGAYAVFAFLMTLPASIRLNELIGHGDTWQFAWNVWWVKTAIFNLHSSVFFTPLMHWPNGIFLYFHALTLAQTIPAVLLSYVVGLVPAYNLISLLTFPLSGFGMYLLARYLTGDHLASFIAGFIYAFSPYHFAHLYGHFNLIAIQWLPFYVLFLLKTLTVGGRRNLLLLATFLAVTFYTDYYYIIFEAMLTVLIVAYLVFFERDRLNLNRVLQTAVAIGLAFLIALPTAGVALYGKLFTNEFDVVGHSPVFHAADLVSFFVPNFQSLFGEITYPLWSRWTVAWESATYTGYTILGISASALFKLRQKKVWFWVVVAIIFAILSLGPFLHINGQILYFFKLPYLALHVLVPIFKIAGVVSRFYLLTYFALAIIVAFSIKHILNNYRRGLVISIALFGIIVLEYWPAPMISSAVEVPKFYYSLAKAENQFAILDISDDKSKILFYQTVHGKPLVGGYTSRPTVSTQTFISQTPILRDLLVEPLYRKLPPVATGDLKVLQSLGIRFVIVNANDVEAINYLEPMAMEVFYEDFERIVYRVY